MASQNAGARHVMSRQAARKAIEVNLFVWLYSYIDAKRRYYAWHLGSTLLRQCALHNITHELVRPHLLSERSKGHGWIRKKYRGQVYHAQQ